MEVISDKGFSRLCRKDNLVWTEYRCQKCSRWFTGRKKLWDHLTRSGHTFSPKSPFDPRDKPNMDTFQSSMTLEGVQEVQAH